MEKITIKDKKLIYFLDQKSRATNKELAKKIGLTEQAIGYKLKRLEEKGIIKKYVTFINTISLGYTHYKVFIKLHNMNEAKEEKLIKALVSNPNIRWVSSTSGKYDLSFSVLAKAPHEFISIYQSIEARFGVHIIEKNIVTAVVGPGFTRDYLVDKKQSKKFEYTAVNAFHPIDDIDKKILKAIAQDARKNIVTIADEIKSSVDVVKYRLKKLKEHKIITGFTIQLDLEKIGYEYYSIFFYTHNVNEEIERQMIQFAYFHPNILFAVKTIGSYDFQFELEVQSYKELEENLKAFRKQFASHIRDFEILRVTRQYKYDFYPF